MKRIFITLLALNLAWLMSGQASARPNDPDPLLEARLSVGSLKAIDSKGSTHIASCTAVDSRLLVTACHGVRDSKPNDITIVIQGKVLHPMSVSNSDLTDVSFMLLPAKEALVIWPKTAPGKERAKVGGSITAIGFSGPDSTFESIPGVINSNQAPWRPAEGDVGEIQAIVVSQALKKGMSGGGAFDEKGRLIGIVIGILPDDKDAGVIMPICSETHEK